MLVNLDHRAAGVERPDFLGEAVAKADRLRGLHVALAKGGARDRAVIIEDRVWIGAGAKILKGVRIGHDSVVAAGAIVTKSCPPRSLLAGVPARRIKEISGWKP